MKQTSTNIPAYSLCLTAALAVRLGFPRIFGGLSERSLEQILDARQWSEIGHWTLPGAPHYFLLAQLRDLLGDSLPAVRWLPVLAGLAVMLLLYLHGLQTGRRRAGLIAVLLYAAIPLALMESIHPSPAASATAGVVFGLYLLDLSFSRHVPGLAVAAGLCWGLAWWIVPGAALPIVAAGIPLLGSRRDDKTPRRIFPAATAGFFALFVPLTIVRYAADLPALSPGLPAADMLGSTTMILAAAGSGLLLLPGFLSWKRESLFDRSAWWMGLVALGLTVTGSPILRETAVGVAAAMLGWSAAVRLDALLPSTFEIKDRLRYALPLALIVATVGGPALAYRVLNEADRHCAARVEALRRLDIGEGVFGGGMALNFLLTSERNVASVAELSPRERSSAEHDGLAGLLRDKKIAGIVLDRRRDDPRWSEELDRDWLATRLLDNGDFIAYRLEDVFPNDRQQFVEWSKLDPAWPRQGRIVNHETPTRLELISQPRAGEPYVPGIDRRVLVELTDEPGGDDVYQIEVDCFDQAEAALWQHRETIDLSESVAGPGVRLAPIALERSKRSDGEVLIVPPMIQQIATVRISAMPKNSPERKLTILARLPLWW
ncbi:MAG TPA: glycosyltransferase family 39 protein [bacterium]|nr:glycosyltransferase family 39 protein [bacterium]